MENTWDGTQSSQKGLHGLAALSFKGLIRLREDDDREAFNKLMRTILPDVQGYIARHLSASVRNGHIPMGKYSVEEFVNELYLLAFEHISEIEDEKDLPFWIFQKADELLQKTIAEEDYNTRFLDNLEKFSKAEWVQMQEEYSTDGEGELTLLEEFDDPSYPKYDYGLADVFVENPEEEWIEELNEEIGQGRIHKHIDMVLHRLPAPMKSIYDLAVNQRFSFQEIAKIKGISVEEVESYLFRTRKHIRTSFKSRYRQTNEQS
jgi:RNA polymerase sigma factor (sigma-70 family)